MQKNRTKRAMKSLATPIPTMVVAAAGAVLAISGKWIGIFDPSSWGDVGTWIAGTATLSAVAAALRQHDEEVSLRLTEQRQTIFIASLPRLLQLQDELSSLRIAMSKALTDAKSAVTLAEALARSHSHLGTDALDKLVEEKSADLRDRATLRLNRITEVVNLARRSGSSELNLIATKISETRMSLDNNPASLLRVVNQLDDQIAELDEALVKVQVSKSLDV